MKKFAIALVAVALMACMIPASGFALTAYNQDFEGLDMASIDALGNDGWLVYANVFGPDMAYWYGYGAFPAPNDGAAFSAIVDTEGGAEQGMQQLVTFSDYNNVDHAAGAYIEANVFQEQTVDAANVGETWVFTFQAKLGNIADNSTALAFIKTLDPGAGWATTNYITEDMTSTPGTWTEYSISLTIDAALEGQIFQIGFSNLATMYESSGIFYDNVNLDLEGSVATDATSWDNLKSLYR